MYALLNTSCFNSFTFAGAKNKLIIRKIVPMTPFWETLKGILQEISRQIFPVSLGK